MEKQIAQAVNAAIASGQTPGAVVLVGRGHEVLLHQAYGHGMLFPQQRPMLPDSIFDLASVTKPVAAATAVMQMVEQRQLALSQPVCEWLPGFDPRITVRHLLTHSSGLQPYKNYLSEWGDSVPPGQRRRRVIADIARLPLQYPPGEGFAYSCLNAVVLASLVRAASGVPLDRYFREHVAGPLGLKDTRFHLGAMNRAATRCAATERLPGGVLCGVVHDEIARYLGGVGGNAGLFGTAADLSRFMRMVLAGGELDGVRVLRKKTVALMTTPQLTLGKLQRGLGWDINTAYTPSVRGNFPAGSFGHTGYTGTSVWADPASRVYLIVLTNRVHISREANVMPLRRKLANIVAKHLIARP